MIGSNESLWSTNKPRTLRCFPALASFKTQNIDIDINMKPKKDVQILHTQKIEAN